MNTLLLGMYSKIFFVQIVKQNKCFSTKLPVVQRKLKFNGNVAVKDDATWAVHFFADISTELRHAFPV